MLRKLLEIKSIVPERTCKIPHYFLISEVVIQVRSLGQS